MSDEEILALMQAHDENALSELEAKYGAYCQTVAFNVLGDTEEAEECVNDALLRFWNAVPEHEPARLKEYLSAIVRNTAINRYKELRRQKRLSPEDNVPLESEEGHAAVQMHAAAQNDPQAEAEAALAGAVIHEFLHGLTPERRKMFVARYLYDASIREISTKLGISAGTVMSDLFRMRKALKARLLKEGIDV